MKKSIMTATLKNKGKYCVYILKTESDTLYTGITNNLQRRLRQHQEKKGVGAKYTRAFGFRKLVYCEECRDRSQALTREAAIKKLNRKQKEVLIDNQIKEELRG